MVAETVVDGKVVEKKDEEKEVMSENEKVLREMVTQTGASEISVKTSVLKQLFGDIDVERQPPSSSTTETTPATTSESTATTSKTTKKAG